MLLPELVFSRSLNRFLSTALWTGSSYLEIFLKPARWPLAPFRIWSLFLDNNFNGLHVHVGFPLVCFGSGSDPDISRQNLFKGAIVSSLILHIIAVEAIKWDMKLIMVNIITLSFNLVTCDQFAWAAEGGKYSWWATNTMDICENLCRKGLSL